MRLNNGTAANSSAGSKGGGGGNSRQGGTTPTRIPPAAPRDIRFEISDDLMNVTNDSDDDDPSWTPLANQIGRGVNDLRNGRSVTPTSSLHSGVSTVRTRQSVQSRASTTASQRSTRRRQTFANPDEPHPYGLESSGAIAAVKPLNKNSPFPVGGGTVHVIEQVVRRRETTFENGSEQILQQAENNYIENRNNDRVTTRSGYISSSHNNANNNKSASKLPRNYKKDNGDDILLSDSETSVDGDGDERRVAMNLSSVSYMFSSVGYYLKKFFSSVCTYIYLFIIATFFFEKWCLHTKRRGGGDQTNQSHIQDENQLNQIYEQDHYQSSNLREGLNGRTHESLLTSELDYQHGNYQDHDESFTQGLYTNLRRRFSNISSIFRSSTGSASSLERSVIEEVESDDDAYERETARTTAATITNANHQGRANGLFGYFYSDSSTSTQESSASASGSSYSNEMLTSIKDCVGNFRNLGMILLRLLLVILLLFLLWNYGSYLWALMGSGTQTALNGVGSALNAVSNGIAASFFFVASSFPSKTPQTAQPIIAPIPSSVRTEPDTIPIPATHPTPIPDSTSTYTSKTVIIQKDSDETLAALKSTQETIDALKLQIASMEQILKDYGVRLNAHDDSFKGLQSEIEKIMSAMRAASAKEKSLEQIIDEVLSATVGETTEGTPVSLKGLFSVLKQGEDRERISREIQIKLEALSEDIGKIKEGFDGEVNEFQTEMQIMHARFEKMETLVEQQKVVEPEVDIEKLKTVILPILASEIQSSVALSCKTRKCPEGLPVGGLSLEDIELMIKRAIAKYDADKTGLPDLALESAGGSILSTRCTKSSELRNSVISYWGFRLWSPPNTPRTIIQPGVVPGECWAFEGSVGDVVIKLAVPAVVTGFTVEHIPKSVSRYGHIDSAPKHFQVLGLQSEHDTVEVHDFGSFTYEDNDESLQYFSVANATARYYPIVELKILSNHGNMRHTCLYRFRVHGAIDLTRSQNGGGKPKPPAPATEEEESTKTNDNSN